jgi:hypothetical protein
MVAIGRTMNGNEKFRGVSPLIAPVGRPPLSTIVPTSVPRLGAVSSEWKKA